MRLMILTRDYPPSVWSGIGAAVALQARGLAALGVEVDVMAATEPAAGSQSSAEDGVRVHRLSSASFPLNPRDFDLVHLHSLALGELAFELKRRFQLPCVYTSHSLLPLELEDSPHSRFWCAVQGRVLSLSDCVIFPGEGDRSAAVKMLPQIATRTRVIPNAVAAPPRQRSLPGRRGPIVFAGRFARTKGLGLLGEVIPLVLARREAQFVIAGGHGDDEGQRIVDGIISRYPENCQLVGWLDRDQLDALFQRAALVVIPSSYEPFGLIALEAMRMGAPVLAAKVGGLAEVVTEESGGKLVESRDARAWAEEIVEMISNPALNRELRSRGPRYVAAKFSTTRIARRLIEEAYSE